MSNYMVQNNNKRKVFFFQNLIIIIIIICIRLCCDNGRCGLIKAPIVEYFPPVGGDVIIFVLETKSCTPDDACRSLPLLLVDDRA